MPSLRTVWRLAHARYLRAAVVALALSAIACSAGVAVIEARYGVSFRAVSGFFLRGHLRAADLSGLIRRPETVRQLEELYLHDTGLNPGGFVYEREGFLTFYPHLPERAGTLLDRHLDNHRIYPRLVRHYLEGDLESLLGEISAPAVLARLEIDGVDSREILDLTERAQEDMPGDERRRLLRRTARHIAGFSPLQREPYELSFAEKLRFYDRQRPEGRFVGMFEVHGFGSGLGPDPAYAIAAGRHSHHLAILRVGPGRFVVQDYYRGELREYPVRALVYPTG